MRKLINDALIFIIVSFIAIGAVMTMFVLTMVLSAITGFHPAVVFIAECLIAAYAIFGIDKITDTK